MSNDYDWVQRTGGFIDMLYRQDAAKKDPPAPEKLSELQKEFTDLKKSIDSLRVDMKRILDTTSEEVTAQNFERLTGKFGEIHKTVSTIWSPNDDDDESDDEEENDDEEASDNDEHEKMASQVKQQETQKKEEQVVLPRNNFLRRIVDTLLPPLNSRHSTEHFRKLYHEYEDFMERCIWPMQRDLEKLISADPPELTAQNVEDFLVRIKQTRPELGKIYRRHIEEGRDWRTL